MITGPSGTSTSDEIDYTEVYRSAYWWWQPVKLSTKGLWKIEIAINNVLAKSYSVTVP